MDTYPERVRNGKTKPRKADYEISCMQAVLDTLLGLQAPMFRVTEAARTDPEFPP